MCVSFAVWLVWFKGKLQTAETLWFQLWSHGDHRTSVSSFARGSQQRCRRQWKGEGWHRKVEEGGEWGREGEGREAGEEMAPAHRGKRTPCLFQQSHSSALFRSLWLSLTPDSQTFHISKGFSESLHMYRYMMRFILIQDNILTYHNYEGKL